MCKEDGGASQPPDTSRVASNGSENKIEKNDAASSNSTAFRVAFVGWSDADFERWRSTTEGTNFLPQSVKREEFASADLSGFDVVLIRAIGWTPSEADREKVAEIFALNVATIAFPSTVDAARESTNVSPESAEAFYEYLAFPCAENVRSGAAFLAANFGDADSLKIVCEQ